MDVKATQIAALQQAMSQAQVNPDQGRQGEFDHWRRIFDAADHRPAAQHVPPGGEGKQTMAAGTLPLGQPPASSYIPTSGLSGGASQPATPLVGAQPLALDATPRLSRVLDSSGLVAAARSADAMRAAGNEATDVLAQLGAHRRPSAPQNQTLTDGRPLSHLEAHLSRLTDGSLQVALRTSHALSVAQALHLVAEALLAQGEATSVDQVFLNGRPIYRMADSSHSHFELDC